MIDKEKFEESVDFVSHFYDEKAFKPDKSFMRTGIFKRRIAMRWIAASVAGVALTAAAFIGYHSYNKSPQPEPAVITEQAPVEVVAPSPDAIIHLEFNDAPLAEVVEGVEDAYGVKLYNLPKEDLHLTLSYEGNAEDFVETVNDLLGTHIKIEK